MGFRSTFITQDYNFRMPEWFVEKWNGEINFADGNMPPFSSKHEGKTYGVFSELITDIQAAIPWDTFRVGIFIFVWLHECGGVTWVQIERDQIVFAEPDAMLQVEEPTCPDACSASRHYVSPGTASRSFAL